MQLSTITLKTSCCMNFLLAYKKPVFQIFIIYYLNDFFFIIKWKFYSMYFHCCEVWGISITSLQPYEELWTDNRNHAELFDKIKMKKPFYWVQQKLAIHNKYTFKNKLLFVVYWKIIYLFLLPLGRYFLN